MNNQKLVKRDIGYIGMCLLLLAAGILYVLNYHEQAFPEHAIDFEVDRQASAKVAAGFLDSLQIGFSGYRHAVIFDYDRTAKMFVEKELGLEKAGYLLSEEFHIWHWSNRWFKSLSKEEYRVHVTPGGLITYFKHIIPEERALPGISIEQAQQLTREFLANNRQLNLNNWEFIEDKTEVKPNRVDYRFTYKKRDMEIYGATYRFDVLVQGDKIGQYREYLKVPEQWQRKYDRLTSLNTTTAMAAQFCMLLLGIAVLVVFFRRLANRDVHLKTALIFGLITFIIQLSSSMNQIPVSIYYFDTHQSFGNFYLSLIIQGILQALLFGVLVTLLTGAAEALYRQHFPGKTSLSKSFSLQGLRSKRAFYQLLIGITLAVSFIAFQTLFYLVAEKYGAWIPAEVSYSDILNTAFPWIFVIFTGFLPAVTEEFTFRLFSIPFFKGLIKSKFLAVLIPAVIWGFAHANYPNQPFWIRGVEVSLFGVLVGVMFLKFGLLTVLVWHYTVDALYAATTLMKSGSPYLLTSGLIAAGIVVLLLLYNLSSYMMRGKFAAKEPLANREAGKVTKFKAPPPTKPAEPSQGIITYQPLAPQRQKLLLFLCGLFFLTLFVKADRIGGFYEYRVPKTEITQTARAFLKQKGFDSQQYRQVLALRKNYQPDWGKYILQNGDIDRLNRLLARYLRNSTVWYIRFFKEMDKEEFRVYVHPADNEVVAFEHLLPEQAEGYDLSKELARIRAKEYLAGQQVDLSQFEIVEDYSQKLDNRTDHTFIFESDSGFAANMAQGRLRYRVMVKGDEIAELQAYYKLPEEWRRAQHSKTTLDSIRLMIKIGAILLIVILAVIYIRSQFKLSQLAWRQALYIVIAVGGVLIFRDLLFWNQAKLVYETSWSLNLWFLLWVLAILIKTILVSGLLFLLLSTVMIFYPDVNAIMKRERSLYSIKDGLLSATLLILGLLALKQGWIWAYNQWQGILISPDFQIPRFLSSNFPVFNVAGPILVRGITVASGVAIGMYFLRESMTKMHWRVLLLLVLIAVYLPNQADTPVELLGNYVYWGMLILWVALAAQYFLRDNLPAYFYAGIGYFSVEMIFRLFRSQAVAARINAYLLILLLAGVVIGMLLSDRDLNIRQYFKRDHRDNIL